MILKRTAIVLALALALVFAFASAAFANFGPHGGYIDDTDSCAGCHRAHTSFSAVGWTDQAGNQHQTALLVGSANTMTEFCNQCHGAFAPGASTNVVNGIFDSGPSGSAGQVKGDTSNTFAATDGGESVVIAYETASEFGAPLNGGGFATMPDPYTWESAGTASLIAASSAHDMEAGSVPLWGAGNAVGTWPNLTCADCHDPHGTSNYRLLKADVNSASVGGYDSTGENPTPFVYSYEQGYPIPGDALATSLGAPQGGWLKHENGATQMAAYRPNYTTEMLMHQDASGAESLSQWCSACHQQYATRNGQIGNATGTYDYTPYEPGAAAPNVGPAVRHRHPVDVTLSAGYGSGRALQEQVVPDRATDGVTAAKSVQWVPLEKRASDVGINDPSTFYLNYLGCLTCHRAHGSSVEMTGWAAASLVKNTNQTDTVHVPPAGVTGTDEFGNFLFFSPYYDNSTGTWMPVRDNTPGVNPVKQGVAGTKAGQAGSTLLRADNRGVCERCHNK